MSANYANDPIEKLGCKGIETSHFDETLIAAFERVSMTFPTRIALSSDVWEPTYRELNETANRLAHRLIACGAAMGDRAAILMSHDAQMVAAVLGALKAGQIVVPLDQGDPVARLKILVEDIEPSVIVTDKHNQNLATEFAQADCQILNFESETVAGPVENLSIEIPPNQTAFLVYTSGTTGRPKGVKRTHRQLCRGAAAHTDAILSTENDRIPLFAHLCTGQGLAVFACTLLNGAMLCPFSVKTRGITELAQWITDRGLTVYFSSASIFRTFVRTLEHQRVFPNVRAVLLATESITGDDFKAFCKHFPPESIFVHTLASSEATVIAWSRWNQRDNIPDGVFPVGHFARDMDVSLLGDDGQPVAHGEVGEIVVKSRYIADGYWRDPELTAERFSADLDGKGTRLVRTGDLGRINAAGLLEFCGRKDDRIKIRGNRIELLDIERTLERLPGIHQAAAVVIPHGNRESILIAFAVKTSDASWTQRRLRHAVRANLPPQMVPSRIVFLDSLPYRGNKIDRETLRQYSLQVRDDKKSAKPRTETEILLAHIWAEILEQPDISRDDDFFNLGGDSLRGAVVAVEVQTALGIELSLEAIADHPTVSALAAFIDERRRMGVTRPPPIVRVPRAASMPLSFNQEAAWDCAPRGAFIRSYRIIGPLNVEIFKECVSYLVGRHEILRTTFRLVENSPVQIVHPSAPLGFSVIDLNGADGAEDKADLVFREAAAQVTDVATLPIIRHVLIRIAAGDYRLARISHLLISDGSAMQILDAELATLYEARLQGREPPLPSAPPLQYVDYAVWQRQVMQPDCRYFTEAVTWWKNRLSQAPSASKLPFRRLIRVADLDPDQGVLRWKLEERAAKRLDEIASSAGATHFIIRLAAFAALMAKVTGNSTVVIGTHLYVRKHLETQNIVGPFQNTIPFVFSYDASKTFLEWVEVVRDTVFEATTRSELPYEKIHELWRASGAQFPDVQIFFMMSRDHSDQQFGNLTIKNEFWSVGTMPWACIVYLDEQKPEDCRVNFDANCYDRNGMRALLDQYLRLLEAAAREPKLPIGTLLTKIGAKPLRWKCEPFYEFVRAFYASSPLLKMLWRPVKRWVYPSG